MNTLILVLIIVAVIASTHGYEKARDWFLALVSYIIGVICICASVVVPIAIILYFTP